MQSAGGGRTEKLYRIVGAAAPFVLVRGASARPSQFPNNPGLLWAFYRSQREHGGVPRPRWACEPHDEIYFNTCRHLARLGFRFVIQKKRRRGRYEIKLLVLVTGARHQWGALPLK